ALEDDPHRVEDLAQRLLRALRAGSQRVLAEALVLLETMAAALAGVDVGGHAGSSGMVEVRGRSWATGTESTTAEGSGRSGRDQCDEALAGEHLGDGHVMLLTRQGARRQQLLGVDHRDDPRPVGHGAQGAVVVARAVPDPGAAAVDRDGGG